MWKYLILCAAVMQPSLACPASCCVSLLEGAWEERRESDGQTTAHTVSLLLWTMEGLFLFFALLSSHGRLHQSLTGVKVISKMNAVQSLCSGVTRINKCYLTMCDITYTPSHFTGVLGFVFLIHVTQVRCHHGWQQCQWLQCKGGCSCAANEQERWVQTAALAGFSEAF